jgi:homoprotocatechuate degradation regulator HpaR
MSVTADKSGVNVKLRSFSRSLPMSLLLAREAVMNRFRPTLKLFNITEQQWRVLRALSSVSEIEVMELAKATSLLAPSLSRILRDMEERGLILRRPVPDDLRRSLTSISPDGLKLIDAVAPYSESTYQEIIETVGREKIDLLQQLCREIVGSLGELEARSYAEAALDPEVTRIVGDSNARGRPRGGD